MIVIFEPTSIYQDLSKSAANDVSLSSYTSFNGGIGFDI